MEVAIAIMSNPSGKHWGYALMQESGVRYYELTERGKRELGALLQQARSETRFRGLNFGGVR